MASKPLTNEQKKSLAAFRQQMGGISEEKRNRLKDQTTIRKAIRQYLLKQPATVPEIAAGINFPADQVFFHLIGMRKYGFVREVGDSGDYVRYAMVVETENKA
ncbi:MAG: hypothetical protein M0Z50_14785 [Planctomycetia bacterium]|jgi:predicted transcriptional regulator|nr:hypothetical protein [Planctomycetia bacterium]